VESSIDYGPKTGLTRYGVMADPNTSDPAVRETGDQARAGETTGVMRYVLGISLVLAVVILSLLVWGPVLFGAK
jgi:hypothetical protein